MGPLGFVSEIWWYPIKSVKGIREFYRNITKTGLEFDRFWVLQTTEGKFLTQRQFPKLALVSAEIYRQEPLTLKVTAPGMAPLFVLYSRDQKQSVKVWKTACLAYDQGDESAAWFTRYLGANCRLYARTEEDTRIVNPKYTRGEQAQVGFADSQQYLILNPASLADLNSTLQTPVTVQHFRPNIVIEGFPAYDEDSWEEIRIGDRTFVITKKCQRCIITTVNPQTGEKDPSQEPLKTLIANRPDIDFGQNAWCVEGEGIIGESDEVEILKRK